MGLIHEEDEAVVNGEEEKKRPGLLGRARSALINAVDQNGDGSLDGSDVSILTDSMSEAAKKAASAARQNVRQGGEQLGSWMDQTRRELEQKALRPVFEETLDSPDFTMTRMIRVTEIDKKHAESEVCRGSIGFMSEHKGVTVVNIYRDKAPLFGLSFYPDMSSGIYYADPCDRDRYVALEDYFNYLKIARVNELQRIAQDLGARHFRVTYKEDVYSETELRVKGSLKGSQKFLRSKETAEVDHNRSEKSSATIEVAAEMECIGHEPVEPKLVYFQRDDSIRSLIRFRMSDNTIKHQKYSLRCSQSSGIRENDAVKIDAALTAMKYSIKESVKASTQRESRRYFEYEIDF